MKKFSMLMLLAGATYALTGCMITDYPCITDTENPDYSVCATTTGAVMHDTKGWAHIVESSQTATDNNGDGIYSTFPDFVTQDTSGAQMIISDAMASPLPYNFHSDQYAQGAQKDIAALPFAYIVQGVGPFPPNVNPNVPFPGVVGPITGNCAAPDDPFDYTITTNCNVAGADLSVLVSYFTRTREAGRMAGGVDAISVAERVDILKNATPTASGLQFTLKPGDLNIVVTQGTVSKTLDMSHLNNRTFTFDTSKKGIVGNEWAKQNGITGTDLMTTRAQLMGFDKSLPVTITATVYGHTHTFPLKLYGGFDAQLLASVLDAANGTGTNGTGSRRR